MNTVDEVREIYTWIDEQPTPRLVLFDGEPVARLVYFTREAYERSPFSNQALA